MSEPPAKQRKCVICGRPQLVAFRPFCSKRCADADLARWLKGGYAIPARETDDGDSAYPGAPPANED